ncbi:odorant receptor 4-like [Linepithema humile]|uniref:odorant receptor 4-like n=1 Tax=Linepithema humile TaxID=83485 RepID=UPI00351F0EE9
MTVTSTISPSLKIGLRFLGMWPNESHPIIYIYMSGILITEYFQYLYISTHFKLNELSNLVDSLMAILVYTLTFLKLASLWIHRPIIHKILAAMDNDWHECINVKQHLCVMTFKANLSHFCSNSILSICVFSSMLYILGDYIIRIVHLVEDRNITLRKLPIKIQLPFEAEHSPTFELLLIILLLLLLANSFTLGIVNALISSLVLHLSGQIDIICHEFKTVSEQISIYGSSKSTLKRLIKKHNRIILFSDNIEKLFSFIALMQVFWDTLIICCLGIIIIISFYNEAGLFMLAKVSLAYTTIMLEIFLFCFAGEYISIKSKLITEAAYDMSWYDMSSKQGKSIMLIIMKSQMRLTITAGRFMNLSLETFTNIMKTSLSFMSVFHAIY